MPLVTDGLVAETDATAGGTIITTESCLLNPNRNRRLDRAEVERELLATLGAEKIVWSPANAAEVETDGHVDRLASIVAPRRALGRARP